MAVDWNLENAAHLLRRAAFGGTPTQIQEFAGRHTSVGSAVEELLSYSPSGRKPPGPRDVDAFGRLKMQRWWFKRMVNAKTPAVACLEKLVLFLHNHLASGASKQPTLKYMSFQNALFRSFASRREDPGDNFRELVRAFNADPANLYYLDGITNFASTDEDPTHDPRYATPNENWGRELMELFTLGVFELNADGTPNPTRPTYTESDVHNVSRASSGWTEISGRTGIWHDYDWDGGQYDDDADGDADTMVIFGQSSDNFRIDAGIAGTNDDILKLIFERVDTSGNNQVGMFLSKKLWTWYAYPPPTPNGLFAGFAATFAASDFNLTSLLTAMWTHDEFYSPAAKSRAIKTPVDFIVQSMRAFGIKTNGKEVGQRELGNHARVMGMNLFEPPNVAGWPGGLTWINAGTLLDRAEFARRLAASDSGRNRLELDRINGLPLGNAQADAGDVVDALLAQLGLDVGPAALSGAQRDILIDYATDGSPGATLDLSNNETSDARVKVRGVISLALQCAESQVF